MSKCDRARPWPSGTGLRLFFTLFGTTNWSFTALFAVLSMWDQRGQIGFVYAGSEAAKAVAVSWDQRAGGQQRPNEY